MSLYKILSQRDRKTLARKLSIPSKNYQKIEIEASQKPNTSEAALKLMIDYWLKEVKEATLYDLAEYIDEMDIKEVVLDLFFSQKKKKLSDRIRRIDLDIPIVETDVERIVSILNLDDKDSRKFAKQISLWPKFLFKIFCLQRMFERSQKPLHLENILTSWINYKHATWKKLVKYLKKTGKIIEASKVEAIFR